jgi:hypothetical protein
MIIAHNILWNLHTITKQDVRGITGNIDVIMLWEVVFVENDAEAAVGRIKRKNIFGSLCVEERRHE